jgi:hypothetical protein
MKSLSTLWLENLENRAPQQMLCITWPNSWKTVRTSLLKSTGYLAPRNSGFAKLQMSTADGFEFSDSLSLIFELLVSGLQAACMFLSALSYRSR